MTKRVTVNMSDDVVKKLKVIQSKKQKNSKYSVTFSKVLSDQLRKVL